MTKRERTSQWARSPEGIEHMKRMREASARSRAAKRKVPDEFMSWNDRMQKAGVPPAERHAAIAKARQEQRT